MQHKDKEIILDSSPEAASIQTVTGWVARDGRFWGDDERMARYCGSTHRQCPNSPEHPPIAHGHRCKACEMEEQEKQWQEMPKQAYTPEAFPLFAYGTERYFFDPEDLLYWIKERGIKPEDARLTQCTPNYAEPIDPDDHFVDDLPEDGEVSGEIWDAFETLNTFLKAQPPLSWRPDYQRGIVLPPDFLDHDTPPQPA